MAALLTGQKWLLEGLVKLEVEVITERVEARLASLSLQPIPLERIKAKQRLNNEGIGILEALKRGQRKDLRLDEEGSIQFGDRLWVPEMVGLRSEILREAHSSPYSVHPRSTKMYKDLKKYLWWENMKKDVTDHVAKYLICQQVKFKHQ